MRRPSPLPGLLLVSWSLLSLAPPVRAAAPGRESERLRRLFDAAWEDKLRLTPEFATYIGFPGHNDKWSDYSPAGIERRHALAREQLKDLLAIDRGRLTATEQVYLDLFRRRLETQIDGFRFPVEETVLSQYDGLQLDVPRTLALAPAATLRDYEDLLARLSSLPALVDQWLALLEKGRATGVTAPKSIRYLADPGLALAYKIGELKIQQLRASAQQELGPAFDLRAFHDEVLRHGAVPLDLLEQNVKTWVTARKAAPRPATR